MKYEIQAKRHDQWVTLLTFQHMDRDEAITEASKTILRLNNCKLRIRTCHWLRHLVNAMRHYGYADNIHTTLTEVVEQWIVSDMSRTLTQVAEDCGLIPF